MELGIEGKVALVTGGSRGLGRQSALSLAHEGVDVGICGRAQETLDQAVEEIRAMGVASMGVVADVSDLSAVETLHQRVVESLGPVDILVNNVGAILSRAEAPALSMEDFKGTFDVNLFGGFQLMKLVIPHMREQRWGRIINFASMAGRETGSNLSYMSAKAALIAATKHAAVTLARDGVLVNSIAPGAVSHPGGAWGRFETESPPEVVREYIDRNLPMGRFGWDEAIGDLVAFLASERASLITGACIAIDGGQGKSMI